MAAPYSIEALAALFRSAQNPDTAKAMEAYMKGHFSFCGIKKPLRETLSKPFLKHWKLHPPDYRLHATGLWELPEREFQYVALEFLKTTQPQWNEETPRFWQKLITTKPWWDSVDLIASTLVGSYFRKFPEQQEQVLPAWIAADHVWLNRTAILFQLKYKQETSTAWLERAILPHLASKEFFHQKAIGWALRQYSTVNPEWVIGFVETHLLAALSKKEALRKLG